MRHYLNKLRLNLGIKRRILNHPVTNQIVASFITPRRLKLRSVPLVSLLPPGQQILLQALPFTPWDTPFNDLVPLCFLACSVRPKRILEIGTACGRATLSLALNNPAATVVSYDINPSAGAYIKGHPLASRIELRLMDVHQDVGKLRSEPPFDFIFIDGDHAEQAVRRDSELAFSVLAPQGMICWHDYANCNWLLGLYAVPEVLADLAKTRDIVSIEGSTLAVFRNQP